MTGYAGSKRLPVDPFGKSVCQSTGFLPAIATRQGFSDMTEFSEVLLNKATGYQSAGTNRGRIRL